MEDWRDRVEQERRGDDREGYPKQNRPLSSAGANGLRFIDEYVEAGRRLETLATHLLAAGDRDLAKAALSEAERLTHTRRLSIEGEKVLKYGTRALLLLPAKAGGG